MDDLEIRMINAGMMPLSEMMAGTPLDQLKANSGVVDLSTFSTWLSMRHEEMLRLRIRLELDEKQDDELYEWAIAHTAVLGEVMANFRAATAKFTKKIELEILGLPAKEAEVDVGNTALEDIKNYVSSTPRS